MEQEGALQQRGQGGRLRSQLVRLLHHRQAAWWFALLAVAGVAQFVSVIGITFILFPTMGRLGYDLDRMSSTNLVAVSLAVSIGVALAASLYASRKYKKTFFDPPSNRIHRRDWHGYATKTGVAIAVPVAYITFVIWALLVLGLVVAARHLVSFPGLPGNPLVWIVPVPAGLALWAFVKGHWDLPGDGHEASPVMAVKPPHWWPSDLPGRVRSVAPPPCRRWPG
jgi:cytochrome bd-type quinol oxidase subunit 2